MGAFNGSPIHRGATVGARRRGVFGNRRAGGVMTQLPPTTSEVKLGLVIDLDTCVGCHACVVACKGWNTENYGAPLGDEDPYGAEPVGSFLNRGCILMRCSQRRVLRSSFISRNPACIAKTHPASPSAQPGPAISAPKTGSCWSTKTPVSAAGLCAWALPLRRTRDGSG